MARQNRMACHSQYRIGLGRRGVEICWFSRKLSLSIEEVSSKSMDVLASVIVSVCQDKFDKKLRMTRGRVREES